MSKTTHTKEEMAELYKKVPYDIRALLLDNNFGPAMQVIGRESGLTPKQSLEAENVVASIMLGIEPLSQFNQLLQKELEIPNEKVQKITRSVDENIFLPIKESLKKIQTTEEVHESKTKDIFVPIPVKSPLAPPASSSTIKPIPPLTLSISPKTIIGAEKIGVDIPSKKIVEHPFEKKLRTVTQPQQKETLASIEKNEVGEESSSTNNKESLIPTPPTPKEAQKNQEKIDPYRELAE